MQVAICLAKFEYCLVVHDKQRYDLGIPFGSLCQSTEFQRNVQLLELHYIPANYSNLRSTSSYILLLM